MRTRMWFVLFVCFSLALIIGYEAKSGLDIRISASPQRFYSSDIAQLPEDTLSFVSIQLPAVDKTGSGALAELSVRITNGDGQMFLSMDPQSPLLNPDTQVSLRLALQIASQFAQVGLSDKNIYYMIATDSEIVGGRSAGAAATIATIAALKKEKLRSDALITGTINSDGSIGRVGKILAKAIALKRASYKTFLVPPDESTDFKVREECKTETIEGETYKSCKTSTVEVNVSEETGIEIIEVASIRDAYELMVSK